MAGYLASEVFESQTPETRRFLIASALLDRISAPLCDALLERDDSRETLEHLRRAGLFLVALDDHHVWFRYHDLFRDFLLSRLPDAERPRYHRRAGDWFAENGQPGEAIRHAVAGGDVTRAVSLARRHIDPALSAGQFAAVIGWLDMLPDEVVRAAADLAGYKAWLLYMRGPRRRGRDLLRPRDRHRRRRLRPLAHVPCLSRDQSRPARPGRGRWRAPPMSGSPDRSPTIARCRSISSAAPSASQAPASRRWRRCVRPRGWPTLSATRWSDWNR